MRLRVGDPVHFIAITPNGQSIVPGSADQTIRVLNNSVEGHSKPIKSHNALIKTVAIS